MRDSPTLWMLGTRESAEDDALILRREACARPATAIVSCVALRLLTYLPPELAPSSCRTPAPPLFGAQRVALPWTLVIKLGEIGIGHLQPRGGRNQGPYTAEGDLRGQCHRSLFSLFERIGVYLSAVRPVCTMSSCVGFQSSDDTDHDSDGKS